jgi:DMSO/TMAO reductase YedYZ molybdopterin-dependent catalytic subunit
MVITLHCVEGWQETLLFKGIRGRDLLLASEINGRTLDAKRGFPFQVVAESKFGYKWVKWVTRIELSDKPYSGFWKKQGYDNQTDVK